MDRDAYLAFDDTSGSVVGRLYLQDPEATYNIEGECENTDELYANFWITLVPGGTPYYGTIYQADDGEIYMEGEQEGTGVKFTMRRQ